ncbi:MAG: hypothetical protein COW00_12455 [Bdellovibrio sp. CG12_big_fil_rev_8_21_14_0_65_39_13]|nr:MAG: hypothetical protein COW78_20165 [Bdellovibrio sp. CG22_combo_CG10-13_8_21_14_all_39_27]PIQ59080.1 MAG: hypothetical protein COW00_12455 [Bdellovibrio sp. CG12_big_fil_rev_8_21_14_0_65_39_13]PIR33591.1 MAG: hypothetical protein COV37_15680 [Bdellovibrio sp. CG11_big_fil_rev_8_21_14_0_20_39_38]PJB53503.1 MAG: hypothetical protein CO099_06755 [Bdellovibrio sp. CG_4_9_14_3_um_filter_39_7]
MSEEELILSGLSLYEFLGLEQILFDMDQKILEKYPEITKDKMMEILKNLEKRGLVESKGGTKWKRVFPKRAGFISKILKYLKFK